MVGQESFLLRMLEPAVRPDARSGSVSALTRRAGSGDPTAPLEQRSFDALLSEAQEIPATNDAEQTSGDDAAPTAALSPLAALAQFDHIENDSLRRVLAQART